MEGLQEKIEKTYYTISEVSDHLGLAPSVIRFCTGHTHDTKE